ncbi:hypothetical protein A9R16_011565 [Acidiferrobacter thiooxydans]|nr:hypothetical protein A9R16_011565 [Acidiferrobacter thiooxydans]
MDPVLLLVFDGFGVSPARRDNGWAQARTPHLDGYFAAWPHIVLQASGTAVGLPDCQFGNSEVGHMTLGAGRVLEQDLGRIRRALDSGEVRTLAAWQGLAAGARRLHLLGLVSDGGVHAHVDHLLGLLRLLHAAAIEPVIHMITDGRDAPPRSAGRYLAMVSEALQGQPGRIGTVSGRYYAMDRAGHWDRTRRAWAAIIKGEGKTAETAEDALAQAYARGGNGRVHHADRGRRDRVGVRAARGKDPGFQFPQRSRPPTGRGHRPAGVRCLRSRSCRGPRYHLHDAVRCAIPLSRAVCPGPPAPGAGRGPE